MKYCAVLFDLDGTLLDTLEDLADSANEVLRSMDLPTHPVNDYRFFVGDGMKKLIERILPEDCRDDKRVEEGVSAMREIYSKRWDRKTRPYDGIADLLNSLRDRRIKMAILSNKPDDFTRVVVDAMLGDWHFDIVRGSKPEVARKPDPTAALSITEELSLAPKDFAYLGDTNTDMKTACAAGMFPVGALWGFRPAEELLENGAEILIERPMELVERVLD